MFMRNGISNVEWGFAVGVNREMRLIALFGDICYPRRMGYAKKGWRYNREKRFRNKPQAIHLNPPSTPQ